MKKILITLAMCIGVAYSQTAEDSSLLSKLQKYSTVSTATPLYDTSNKIIVALIDKETGKWVIVNEDLLIKTFISKYNAMAIHTENIRLLYNSLMELMVADCDPCTPKEEKIKEEKLAQFLKMKEIVSRYYKFE